MKRQFLQQKEKLNNQQLEKHYKNKLMKNKNAKMNKRKIKARRNNGGNQGKRSNARNGNC